MGLVLGSLSTLVGPARKHALTSQEYVQAFWTGEYVPDWNGGRSEDMSPELALTLSYVYAAVDIISSDFGTMTCQLFQDLGNDDKQRVTFDQPGIGLLAYRLRWQPNPWQTAKAFWSTLAYQYLLRPACYAEIVMLSQPATVALIPRHPDRVREATLPNGTVQFRLREADGSYRFLTQDEMFVVRNTSTTGLNALSRIQYGAATLSSALALQDYHNNYFRKGATAALLATYKGGPKEDEDEKALHQSISRFMGAENAGGLLLVSDDIEVKALGVDPEKAQLLGLKNLSGRDIARLFKMPPSWLGIENSTSYASETQDEARYVKHTQTPLVVEFEQAIQRDLIVSSKYYAKFNLDYLMRADLLQRMQAYEIGIRSRVMRPSEARVLEDMNRDPELDALSAMDHRPGATPPAGGSAARASRAALQATLDQHDKAIWCVRRERNALEKLGKKHAQDAAGWRESVTRFYADHAAFVRQAMAISDRSARGYAADHAAAIMAGGLALIEGEAGPLWEREEAQTLCALALTEAA